MKQLKYNLSDKFITDIITNKKYKIKLVMFDDEYYHYDIKLKHKTIGKFNVLSKTNEVDGVLFFDEQNEVVIDAYNCSIDSRVFIIYNLEFETLFSFDQYEMEKAVSTYDIDSDISITIILDNDDCSMYDLDYLFSNKKSYLEFLD